MNGKVRGDVAILLSLCAKASVPQQN
uniref:Uncharacterized protein n=1 Tax=Anguilla anguilla TaxID=7936 RepID=A0A0E9QZ94_ANGAN